MGDGDPKERSKGRLGVSGRDLLAGGWCARRESNSDLGFRSNFALLSQGLEIP